MSLGMVYSATLHGMEVKFIRVEADLSNGLPMFHMVGYLSSEVKEAGERVRTAIRNSGLEIPVKKTVINLSPGSVRKRGASFDLPIALAILASQNLVRQEALERVLAVGELGLDGSIRDVPGVLPIVWEARKQGYRLCIVPAGNEAEAALVEGVPVLAAGSLAQLLELLEGKTRPSGGKRTAVQAGKCAETAFVGDFQEVRGQGAVKRAAEIAVAGGHNFLMVGPPGSGKSMIARRIPTILPPLEMEEALEITKIYSVQGMLEKDTPLIRHRPFREVHHTVTKAALIGGGLIPAPGEISLAHKGVLFLDELTEFSRPVLEVLRQPLEEKRIRLTRKQGVYEFPADFMLAAAMNPCPCGYYPDAGRCTCTPASISQYLGKVSQPFLSRIDICMDTPAVEYRNLQGSAGEETSEKIRQRVCLARERQLWRYRAEPWKTNASLPAKKIPEYCALGDKEEAIMEHAFKKMDLTARTYHKVLKVARTIADLDGKDKIQSCHLSEAIGYRLPDTKYWGNLC